MLGAAHALANPLTATYGIAHGEAIALDAAARDPPQWPRRSASGTASWSTAARELTVFRRGSNAAETLATFVAQTGPTGRPGWYTQQSAAYHRASCRQLAAAAAEQWTGTFNPGSDDLERLSSDSMKRRCKRTSETLLLAVVVLRGWRSPLSARALADDWPLVRRDTSGSGVAESSLPKKLDVLWTYHEARPSDDAGFEATAVVANGIVYVGDNAGTFHAVRLADGKAVWTQQFPDTAFLAGAAWDDGTLYVGDANGIVRCLSIADGNEIWNTEGRRRSLRRPDGPRRRRARHLRSRAR